MIKTALRRKFAGGFFRKMIDLPKRAFNLDLEPQENNSTYGNQTKDAFDAVSQEWQSAIISNAYDLQSMAYYDAVAQMNFGTVDNPHVIYTADTPFRYVICTGQPNEDDFEGHEALVFMLREGPLQRCPQCGQVYKLVRLRNEFSAEMDYYRSGLLPLDVLELGEADHWSQNSFVRLMPNSFEHTQFEVESSASYSLVNPDEHDRILTDPAYRLEKITKAREAMAAYASAIRLVDQEYRDTHPVNFVIPLNKVDYQTMLDIESAIRKTDRIYASLRRFHARQFLDPANHSRREKRMLDRLHRRQVDSYTVFFGGLSEQEQQVKDYFETEEKENIDEATRELLDEESVRSMPEYRTEKFDFQELYSRQPVEDASSIEDRLVFRFVNRRCMDTVSDYERRQSRMAERSSKRLQAQHEALNKSAASAYSSGNAEQVKQVESQYFENIIQESINQYADYFESEGEEAPGLLKSGSIHTKSSLLEGFRDYTKIGVNHRGFYSIPKRRWDLESGLTMNILNEFGDYSNFVLPKVRELNNNVQLTLLQGSTEKYALPADQIAETTKDAKELRK